MYCIGNKFLVLCYIRTEKLSCSCRADQELEHLHPFSQGRSCTQTDFKLQGCTFNTREKGKDSQCSAPSLTREATRASATGKIQHFMWIRKSIGQDILLNNYALSIHASTSVLPILATNHFGDYMKGKSCHSETGEAQFSTASKDLTAKKLLGIKHTYFCNAGS